MSTFRTSLRFAAFVMLLLPGACMSPTTKFTSLWKDETYQGRPGKIFVVSVFPDPNTRKIFEDEFVNALKTRGIDAVASFTVMPDPVVSDKAVLAARARAAGADTMMTNISRDASETDKFIAGGQVGDWYIHLTTDIYDIPSERSIISLSAAVHIVNDKTRTEQIQAYIKDVMQMLSQQKLF